MADKKVSETIKQQRFAQKEFLELKKMESGEIKPEPKPSKIDSEPKTFKGKLSNIWYHFKWAIISVALAAVVISVCIAQCASRTDYDMKIVVYSESTYIPDELNNLMAEYIEKICPDINGNGKTDIQVINCSYSDKSTDAQNQILAKTKLQTSLAAEDSAFIYITDEKGLDYLNQIAEGVFHGESVKLDGDFYDYCNKNDLMKLPDGLYISCREIEGAAIGKSKNAKKIFDASQEVMEKIGVKSE